MELLNHRKVYKIYETFQLFPGDRGYKGLGIWGKWEDVGQMVQSYSYIGWISLGN